MLLQIDPQVRRSRFDSNTAKQRQKHLHNAALNDTSQQHRNHTTMLSNAYDLTDTDCRAIIEEVTMDNTTKSTNI